MAEVAQILIEIAQKRGYEAGDLESAILKKDPITKEERTIQVFTLLAALICMTGQIF